MALVAFAIAYLLYKSQSSKGFTGRQALIASAAIGNLTIAAQV
jgi:hypothetical protein